MAVSEFQFKAGMRLLLHLFFRAVLRCFLLASTQVLQNGWSQLAEPTSFIRRSQEIPLRVFQTLFQPRVLGKDELNG